MSLYPSSRREWTLVLAGVSAGAAIAVTSGAVFALPNALNRAASAMAELSIALKEQRSAPLAVPEKKVPEKRVAPARTKQAMAVAVPAAAPQRSRSASMQDDDDDDEVRQGVRQEGVQHSGRGLKAYG